MKRNTQSVYAVFLLPLVLSMLLQGGSCRNSERGASSTNRSNANNANVSATTASHNTNAAGVAAINATGNAAGAGVDAAKTTSDTDARKERTPVKQNAVGDGLAVGGWGGTHIQFNVTTSGARVEFDCATGEVNRKISLDADGRFEVDGLVYVEHGGPVRVDEKTEGKPARYSGKVEGKTLTLSVTLTDSQENIGTFTLTHGKSGRLMKCM